jgi:DNA-binding NarL/FixJ family response regulator
VKDYRWEATSLVIRLRHSNEDTSKIAEMQKQGLSLREIAAALGISAMTVQRRVRVVSLLNPIPELRQGTALP